MKSWIIKIKKIIFYIFLFNNKNINYIITLIFLFKFLFLKIVR